MKATVVHYIDSDTFGGAERALGHLLKYHDRQRWRPLLFHHGAPGLAPLRALARGAGVDERAVPAMQGLRGGRRLPGFTRALRREHPLVLHAHLTWALGCSWGLLAAAAARVPARVATVQLFRAHDGVKLPAVQRTLVPPLVHRYIAVSDHVRGQLRAALGVADRRIAVIRNGVPCPSSADESEPRAAARARLFPAEARTIALTVARLDAQKGLDQILAAAARIDDVLFVVAGAGPLRSVLEERAAAARVADRVRFLGHRDDVDVLLRAADVFLLPSLHEGLPLSVLEAACAGTPVIASRIGGTDEVIAHGVHGLLFDPGDIDSMVAALRRLKQDEVLTRRLAVAAHERVAREFDAAAVATRVEALYEELIRA